MNMRIQVVTVHADGGEERTQVLAVERGPRQRAATSVKPMPNTRLQKHPL